VALNVGNLYAELHLNDASFNRTASQSEGRMKRLGGVMSTVVKTAAVAGAGAVAGMGVAVGASVSKAADFEKSMRLVGTTLGESGQRMDELTALATKMGAETTFSAQGASDAMVELAKGGLTAAQIKAGALQSTLTLATAGGLGLADASTYMVQGLTTFGLKAGQAGEVAAALAGGANASTASVESMGQALSQVGPGAKTAGLSLQETTAALAAFDNAGIKGSDAGTSLKTMLVNLVPSTDKAKSTMDELGLKFTDAQGNFLSLSEIAGQLQGSLQGLSQKQRTVALATIFGSDATRAASVLADQGAAGITKLTKATSDQSAAQNLAQNATKGYAGAMEAFQGGLETLQIQLGTKFLPVLTSGLGFLTSNVLPRVSSSVESAASFVKDFSGGFTKAGQGVAYFGSTTEKWGATAHEWFWKVRQAARDLFPVGEGGGVDFAAILDRVVATAQQLWPAVQQGVTQLQGVGPVLDVAGAGFGFLADHIDTVVKYLPLLIAAFVAYKAAQAASTLAGIAQLPVTAALAASNFAHAAAINALLAAMGIERTSRIASLVLWLRSTATIAIATVRLYAHEAGLLIVAGAQRALTAAQWLLNAAMTANPIGLVIAALVLLGAGLVVAYKHSETFRNIVNGAFSAVKHAATALWEDGIKPAFGFIKGAFDAIGNAVVSMWDGFIRPTLRTFIDGYTRFAGGIVGTAAKVAHALGMKGLAADLDNAAGVIKGFRDTALAALDMPDQRINVTAFGKLVLPAGFTDQDAASFARRDASMARRRATGGPITGPGTGTSDSIPTLLSNGEHVWTAKEVQKAGGHSAVQAMRAGVLALANGGPVLNVRAHGHVGSLADVGELRSDMAGVVRGLGNATMNSIAAAAARASATAAAAATSRATPTPTSAGRGNVDAELLRRFDQFNASVGGVLNIVSGYRSSARQAQLYAAYLNGTGNLAARPGTSNHEKSPARAIDYGPASWARTAGAYKFGLKAPISSEPWHLERAYDSGGYLEPGDTLAHNKTGKREGVFTAEQTANIKAMAGGMRLHPDDLAQLGYTIRQRPVQLYVDGKLVAEYRERNARGALDAAGVS